MTRHPLLLVVLACAAPRLAALLVWPVDTGTLYYALATSLAQDGRFAIDREATTHIEPLYPALLAGLQLIFGDRPVALLLAQIAVASAAGVGLFAFTRAQTGDGRAAWVAALLYAASPYLIRQSVSFMEVTPVIALLIAATWRMRRIDTVSQAAAAGIVLGALCLTRMSLSPIVVCGLILIARRDGTRRALLVSGVIAACVVPWMAFSRTTEGSALPARIGDNLYVSTSALAEPIVPRYNVDLLMPLVEEIVRDEMARRGVTTSRRIEGDRLLLELTAGYVRAHPLRALRLKLRNLVYIFQPRLLPFYERRGMVTMVDGRLQIPEQARRPVLFEAAAAGYQTILIAGGIAGMVMKRRRLGDDAFLLIVAGSVIAVNAIFFPTSRLLAPMTFVWMFYAGVTASALRRGRSVSLTNGRRRSFANRTAMCVPLCGYSANHAGNRPRNG